MIAAIILGLIAGLTARRFAGPRHPALGMVVGLCVFLAVSSIALRGVGELLLIVVLLVGILRFAASGDMRPTH